VLSKRSARSDSVAPRSGGRRPASRSIFRDIESPESLLRAAMTAHSEFILHYGYAVVFAWVFLEQLGLPLPAAPLLLGAGALAGVDQLNPVLAVVVPTAAALAANLIWYELGRRRGAPVLQFLCRISLEPDSCVRKTEDIFARHGARSLLAAKFVPGLNTVAPPLAGIFRMRLWRFILFNGIGTALWAGAFVGAGFAFSDQVEWIVDQAPRVGSRLLALVLGTLAAWVAWKFIRRRRFIRKLRIDRITPQELKRKLDAGEPLAIVDLRGSLDFEAEPGTIPGALHMKAGDLDGIRDQLASAPEVILYCT
jgi:membrane protein DedA with SNARE-associated domain